MTPTFSRAFAFVAVVLFSVLMSGCAVRARGAVYASDDPGLVLISPGVYVVEGYSATAYYTSGHYYYYDSGTWYRSSQWGGARVRIEGRAVPRTVYSRDHARYRRYHATSRASVRRGSEVRGTRATRTTRTRRPTKRATVPKRRPTPSRTTRSRRNDRERSEKRRTDDRKREQKRRSDDRKRDDKRRGNSREHRRDR